LIMKSFFKWLGLFVLALFYMGLTDSFVAGIIFTAITYYATKYIYLWSLPKEKVTSNEN